MEGSEYFKSDQPAGESPRPCRKIMAAGPLLQADDAEDDIAAAAAVDVILLLLAANSMNDRNNDTKENINQYTNTGSIYR